MLTISIIACFIGLSAGLAAFFISRDRGPKEPIGALWLAVAFGVLGAVVAGYLEDRLVNANNLMPGLPAGIILPAAMAVALIEETCKFVPLAIYIYRKPYFNEHTDGVIYFALVGLGFGLPENILYTLLYGNEAGFARLLLTPLFHASITGMVGYYFARNKLAKRPVSRIIWPLAAAVILHGLYDFGLLSDNFHLLALSITLGLSVAIFVLFMRATRLDKHPKRR